MLNISFRFEEEPVTSPSEYTMGYMRIEFGSDNIDSEELQGRGLMMVFFSVSSLLEMIYKLTTEDLDEYRFVGEDSSFILFFNKNRRGEIDIVKDKKTIFTVGFDDLAKSVWSLSKALYREYGDQMLSSSSAKKDWVSAIEKISPVIKRMSV